MELLFEMLKKIENGILPSRNEVIYLNNEATTPRTGGNWKQKLNMSKIKLFCKFYEVLFCEKSGRFKFFELLEPNEKNYLKDFVNLEIACLEKVSGKTQNFIDEIDQIKKLSYSTIKKADFAFETEGKIFKYWTLNKNMVPEGEEDLLESQDCVFKTAQNEIMTIKFKVYSDLQSNWKIQAESSNNTFPEDLNFSLCVAEKNISVLSVSSIYFPCMEMSIPNNNVKTWSLDMKHLHYPDREATFIFSCVGTMETKLNPDTEHFHKTPVVKDLGLMKQINEFQYEKPEGPTVSLSLVLCNFIKNIIIVKEPYLTSGKVDSRLTWPKKIEPCSVTQIYTKKKDWGARGSVGTCVLTVQHEMRFYSFAVYWHSPYDFNLYKNSFAIFPLPGQTFSSEYAAKSYKDFIEYSNAGNTDEKHKGVRGFAKDGPKAFEYCGLQVSAKMGVNHVDALQVSIFPANNHVH